MDWKKIIDEIVSSGLPEDHLAYELNVKQSTINRIRRGKTKNPGYSTGDGILRKHRELCGEQST